MRSLQLMEFSDRELAARLGDVADDEGWATAMKVAQAINLDTANPARNVTSRFTYLKRIGVMESVRNGSTTEWRLTSEGISYISGHIDSRSQRALDRMKDAQLLAAASYLSRRSNKTSGPGRNLIRREWRYGLGR